MNDVIDIQSTATEIRTAEVVAMEVRLIKRQTQKVMLQASMEIGKRLEEAKSLVDHGNWSDWLKENVEYSQRTAEQLIQIYHEYGDKGMDSLFNENMDAFKQLSYTQAVALLSLPTVDDRLDFVEKHDIEDMSVRELQDAIKAQKDAEEEVERLKISLDCQKDNIENMKNQAKEKSRKDKEHIKELNQEIERLKEKSKNENSQEKEQKAQEEISQLQQQMDALRLQDTERMNQMQRELETAKQTAADTNLQAFTADLDVIQHSFNRMLAHIQAIQDAEKREKFKRAAKKLLEKLNNTL